MDGWTALQAFTVLLLVHATDCQTVTVSGPGSAASGTNVLLTCTVNDGTSNVIQWTDTTGGGASTIYTGSQRFSLESKYLNFRVTSLSTTASVMTIENAEVEDDGTYLCTIPSDSTGQATSLVIEAASTLTLTVDSIVTSNVDMYQGTCDTIGGKPQETITWTLGGVTQTDGNGNTIVETNPTATPPLSNTRSVFTFPATVENYGQTLVCETTGHQIPELNGQESINLNIHSSPIEAGTTVTAGYVTQGTGIIVSCKAANQPNPNMRNYYIYSNDMLIHESADGTNEYTVSDPVVGTNYTCLAGNYLGNTSLTEAVTYDPRRTTTHPSTTVRTEGTTSEPRSEEPIITGGTILESSSEGTSIPPTTTESIITEGTTSEPRSAEPIITEGTTSESSSEEPIITEGTTSESSSEEPSPNLCTCNGLGPGASAGIAVLAILLAGSVIINVIQFIAWRRHSTDKNEPQQVTSSDVRGVSNEANDIMAYEMIQSGDRVYTALKLSSSGTSRSATIDAENVTFFTRLGSIGRGDFGAVWKGELRSNQGLASVAIRQIPDHVSKSPNVLQSVKVLCELSDQPNVVKCLGFCQELSSIIYEFISGGTLLTHLQMTGVQSQPTYSNLKPNRVRIDEESLLNFACQIAKGMQFLASKKITHGTLCAHDILLDERKQCKLADYGLASSLFSKRGKPTRWNSPETMVTGVLSTEGDIWSFGIVLWEIVTLGARPYPNMAFDTVQKEVTNGFKMPCPRHCGQELYTIMSLCWENEPRNRSNFDLILKSLERILKKAHNYLSLNNLDEGLYVSTLDM